VYNIHMPGPIKSLANKRGLFLRSLRKLRFMRVQVCSLSEGMGVLLVVMATDLSTSVRMGSSGGELLLAMVKSNANNVDILWILVCECQPCTGSIRSVLVALAKKILGIISAPVESIQSWLQVDVVPGTSRGSHFDRF